MTDLILALPFVAYMLFAFTNVTDKYLINIGIKPHVMGGVKYLITAVMLLLAIIIFAPNSFFEISFIDAIVLLSIGVAGAISTFFFYRAMTKHEITHFIPYYQSVLVVLPFIASVIILSEFVNLYNIAGLVVIVAGVYITGSKKFRLPTYATDVHVFAILNASQSFLIKVSAISIYPLLSSLAAYFISGAFMAFMSKSDLPEFGKFKDRKNLAYIIAAALISFLGTSALVFALANISGAKVFPVSGIYLVFVVLLGGALLKETDMKKKIIGSILIVLGIYGVFL